MFNDNFKSNFNNNGSNGSGSDKNREIFNELNKKGITYRDYFDKLVNTRKEIDRVKNLRDLTQEEMMIDAQERHKLVNFYNQFGHYIKARKNSFGKFSVEDFISINMSQFNEMQKNMNNANNMNSVNNNVNKKGTPNNFNQQHMQQGYPNRFSNGFQNVHSNMSPPVNMQQQYRNENPNIIKSAKQTSTPKQQYFQQQFTQPNKYNATNINQNTPLRKINEGEIKDVLNDFDYLNSNLMHLHQNHNQTSNKRQNMTPKVRQPTLKLNGAFVTETNNKKPAQKQKSQTKNIKSNSHSKASNMVARNNFIDDATDVASTQKKPHVYCPQTPITKKETSNGFVGEPFKNKLHYALNKPGNEGIPIKEVFDVDCVEPRNKMLTGEEQIALDMDSFLHFVINEACAISSTRPTKKLNIEDVKLAIEHFKRKNE